MSITGRALATTTGHPALKLVLLTVAASPGWPTAADVAAAAELEPMIAAVALSELLRVRLVVAHSGTDATRYGLPDDGWTFDREPDDPEPEVKAAAPVPPDVFGYAPGRTPARDGMVQP